MRSKLVLGSLFACAILIACSSSNNSSVLDDTDAGGDDDTDKPSTSTKKDSGTSSTKDAGKDSGKDSGRGTDKDATTDDDGGTGAAKVGDLCTDSTTCSGTVAEACSNDGNADSNTLDPSPFCLGACDGSTIECDGPGTICDPNFGLCMPGCRASATAVTTACKGKNACTLVTLDDATGDALGSCGGGCKANTDCTGGDKCQVETGFCVKTLATAPSAPGQACTGIDDCVGDNNCIFPDGKSGYCTKVCTVGSTTECPTGFTCAIGTDPTVFDGNPPGVQGNCWKTCTAATDCSAADAASWECATVGGGVKVCLPAATP